MRQRVITAVVALAIFLPILYLGGIWLEVAAAVLGLVALSEIFIMRKKIIVSQDALIAGLGLLIIILPAKYFTFLPAWLNQFDLFYMTVMVLLAITVFSKNRVNFDDIGVTTLSMLYVGFGFHYLIGTRAILPNEDGLIALIYILLVIWSTDIFAYTFGRTFGKHKLWPAISPNKTIEGSVGGTLAALVIALVFLYFFPVKYDLLTMVPLTLIFSVGGQIGDLIESALKRYYDVKDSGKILPGHGGILDRFDSLLFVLPLLHFFGLV